MPTKIQLRRDTAADWTSNNPTLAAGEFGWESDTNRFKIGTGSAAWNSLEYADTLKSLGDMTITGSTIMPASSRGYGRNCAAGRSPRAAPRKRSTN